MPYEMRRVYIVLVTSIETKWLCLEINFELYNFILVYTSNTSNWSIRLEGKRCLTVFACIWQLPENISNEG